MIDDWDGKFIFALGIIIGSLLTFVILKLF